MKSPQEISPSQRLKLDELVLRNKDIFWHFDKSKLHQLSHAVIIEYFLNYSDLENIRSLFNILGVDYVAEIFYEQNQPGKRINLQPRTLNFFDLYFKRYASPHFKQRAVGTPSLGPKI